MGLVLSLFSSDFDVLDFEYLTSGASLDLRSRMNITSRDILSIEACNNYHYLKTGMPTFRLVH